MKRTITTFKFYSLVILAIFFAQFEANAQKVTAAPIDKSPYKIRCSGVDCTVFTGKDGLPLPAGEGSVECPYYKSPAECCATLPPGDLLNVCKDPIGMYCQDCVMNCECRFWDSGRFYTIKTPTISNSYCPSLQPPSKTTADQNCSEPCKNAWSAQHNDSAIPPWITLSGVSSYDVSCTQSHRKIIEEVLDEPISSPALK